MRNSTSSRTRAVCATLLTALLFAPAVVLRAGEGEDQISGTWSISASIPGVPTPQGGTLELALGADGTTVTGVARDETMGDETAVSGTFVAGRLALTIDLSTQGGPIGSFDATVLADGTLSGTFSAGGMVLVFTGTRTSGGATAAVVTSGAASVGSGAAAIDSASAAAAASAQAAAMAAQQAQMRLQRLMQMPVDRRPSAILRAWVRPKRTEAEPGAEGAVAPPGPADPLPGESIMVLEEEMDGELPPELRAQLMQQLAMHQAAQVQAGGAPAGPADPLAAEVEAFQRDVTLGDWAAVGSYLSGLPADHWKQVHLKILQMLPMPPQNQQPRDPAGILLMEKNVVTPRDVLGLADAAPVGTDAQTVQLLGVLVREAEQQGHMLEPLIAAWEQGTKHLGGQDPERRRAAVEVLLVAGKPALATPFLPAREQAEREGDAKALDLLARHYLALHGQEQKKLELLEAAWTINLRLLSCEKLDDALKYVALERAIQLVPRVKEELGQAWLRKAFDQQVERGRDVLALTGAVAGSSRMLHGRDAKSRLAALRLQHVAGSSLIKLVPERAREWSDKLELLLRNWLVEVDVSIAYAAFSRQMAQLRRDRWGNYYYYEDQELIRQQQQRGQAQPIGARDLLELRPDDAWIALTPGSLRPRLLSCFARLHLIQKETDQAFPLIEQLAATRPKEARELAQETLQLWIEEHDLNADQSMRGRYVFMWGYEERADGIPLTRSKQERNLAELAGIVARLRQLPVEPIDEKLLAQAFVRAHGSAEVYRLEAVERVFGSVGGLDPATLAGLVQTMRANLAKHWRDPEVQKQQKTKRTKAEIEAEVVRGYEVALRLADDGLSKHADRWELLLARAAVLHDMNEYVRRELKQSPEYAAHRQTALEGFSRAAAAYTERLPRLKEEEERLDPFEMWFHAALGACDLGRLSQDHRPDLAQPPLIRAALERLPGEPGERARAQFATQLFTRLSAVSPAMKFNYLKAGFMVVGEHPDAREARKVFDYYRDLVTEIQLVTRIDGPDRVGHARPFGLFVEIRHTEHIERESGGFSKYLQNQNQGSYFYWNYGRPLEDYRDKFEEAAREALSERFEVLSVTFQEPTVKSRPDRESGWRVTPYAYLLLKPRGPEVDRIGALELNLDFLDTSGYAVLPVASAPIPIDAKDAQGAPRPVERLELTQTLDERRAAEGLLVLEVKATARGLIPDLEQVLEPIPAGFRVEGVDDAGTSVVRMDAEKPVVYPVSERLWTLKLKGKEGQARLPDSFAFPTAKVATEKVTWQRFVDEDLAQVGREVPLVARYGATSARWPWGLGLLAILGLGAWAVRRSGGATAGPAVSRFQLPARLTPFTVQTLLARIRREAPLPAEAQQELDRALADLDARWFARAGGSNGNGHAPQNGAAELESLARRWVDRAG